MAKRDIKNEITTKIIDLIETHGSDWVKPFGGLCGAPVNALTGKSYRGMNSFWLGLQGQTYWATYKQWQELGAQVLKGSKASGIAVPMPIKDKETDKVKGLYFRGASVFSAAQVEGWEAPTVEAPDLTEVLANVDTYLKNIGADVRIVSNSPLPIPVTPQNATTARYSMSTRTGLVINPGLTG